MIPRQLFQQLKCFASLGRAAQYACLCTCFLAPLAALAEIQITDSHGKYRFAESPKRVVALNWTLAEQMLELGEIPIGMADIKGFQRQTSLPVVPETVVDVGERLSPTLRHIRALKPDIILIGYSQRSLLRPLSNIATVIYFKNFGQRYNNFEKSRERFLEMAKLFDKTAFAENKLAAADKQLSELRAELAKTYPDGKMPLLQITIPQSPADIKNNKPVWTFGNNSLPYYAAKQLGLDVISPDETNQFGTAQVTRDDLTLLGTQHKQAICHVYLSVYQDPKAPNPAASTEPCVVEPAYQNAFGGALSVLYFAKALHQALMRQKI
ncbi:MAG: ABC transporter substrate-binding protein [Leucothrix sp.]